MSITNMLHHGKYFLLLCGKIFKILHLNNYMLSIFIFFAINMKEARFKPTSLRLKCSQAILSRDNPNTAPRYYNSQKAALLR